MSSRPPLLLAPATLISEFVVPGMTWIEHIVYVNSQTMWVGNCSTLRQVFFAGGYVGISDVMHGIYGGFDITEDGNLLYVIMRNVCTSIEQKTTEKTSTIVQTPVSENINCIHYSQINGDILVGIYNASKFISKITRYNSSGKIIQDIEVDYNGQRLYRCPEYITENINGDIITSDPTIGEVVVVDRSGQHRFNYHGPPIQTYFSPGDICTDNYGHILVTDYCKGKSSIHLIDQNGIFQTLLLTDVESKFIHDISICVNDKLSLFVGCEFGKVKVYKYLQKTQNKIF